jgi:hypothetical protein
MDQTIIQMVRMKRNRKQKNRKNTIIYSGEKTEVKENEKAARRERREGERERDLEEFWFVCEAIFQLTKGREETRTVCLTIQREREKERGREGEGVEERERGSV